MNAPTITVTTSPIVLLFPGPNFGCGYVQNTGENHLSISLDGNTDPTATSGMIIYAGTQLWLPDYVQNPIKARTISGTTTVQVGTDDLTSTAYPNAPGN